MKKILITSFFIIAFYSNAQVESLETRRGKREVGKYYKDINNVLDQYVGTWIHNVGNIYLKITFAKAISYNEGQFTEDILYGGMEYKVNNVTIINTINDFNTNRPDKWYHDIVGNSILKQGYPGCRDCTVNEKRLNILFKDRIGHATATIFLQKITVNGQEAIKLFGYYPITARADTEPQKNIQLPLGDIKYTLIKQ
jgi:hypothetical protein